MTYEAFALFKDSDDSIRKLVGFTQAAQGKAFCMDKDNLFISTEELIDKLSLAQMVTIYNKYADKEIKKFKDKTTGAERLWHVLEVSAQPSVYDKTSDGGDKSRIEHIPRRKKSDRLYVYEKVDDFEKAIAGMPKQAKDLAHIVKAELRSRWTEPELKQVIHAAARSGALKTKQDPWRIFQYYRSHLLNAGILRLTTRSLRDI